jgi:argininosuccinate synthase
MTTRNNSGAKPIVLAYSGGLDTSFLVPWLAENYQRPIITVTVDTGGIDAAAAKMLHERALALGAIEHHQIDARVAYFEQVLRFLIMGNVRRGQLYPLCVGAERVMQAQQIAYMARKLGTHSIAHGCTAAGNDQVRFEVALRTLAPELEIIAPVRDRAFKRQEELEFLQQRNLPVPPFGAAYSINRGLLSAAFRKVPGCCLKMPSRNRALKSDTRFILKKVARSASTAGFQRRLM